MRLAQGIVPEGIVVSEPIDDLDSLPFPRWDLVTEDRDAASRASSGRRAPWAEATRCSPAEAARSSARTARTGFWPATAPARSRTSWTRSNGCAISTRVRTSSSAIRSSANSATGVSSSATQIEARGLKFTFEAETRLDRLDAELLDRLYAVGFRAMSFGVESLDPATLKKSGRRPIPQAHQREILEHCRKLGIVTAAFYVLGFLQDDWNSIAATIDYAIDLGSTFAQFKILTPYPGTPMFKQLEPLLTETNWEKFDGYSPTFKHPNLTAHELQYLLGSAYKRFYMRPSYLANFLKIQNPSIREWVGRMDQRVEERHSREEIADISRPVTHAECDFALRSASPAQTRRHRRGLQGPRRAHPGSPDSRIRSRVRPARRDGRRRTPSRPRTAGWRSTTS